MKKRNLYSILIVAIMILLLVIGFGYIWFVDEFPMTVTGKLQKFRMREIALEKLQES